MFSGLRSLHNNIINLGRRLRLKSGAPIYDVILVEMFECQDKFRDIESCAFLAELGLFLEMPKQFSSTFEIRDEIEISIRLETEFEPNQERGCQGLLEDFPLAYGVRNLLLSDDLLL